MYPAHWSDLTADPNSREAFAFRRKVLRDAHAKPVRSRNEFFAQQATAKKVLDVGCVDHLAPGMAIAPLHRRLAEVTDRLIGVDMAADGIAELRNEGFSAQVADVTKPGLVEIVGSGFDVVTAGEIIEHLLDLSAFFGNIREVLKPDGLLILSTPNPNAMYYAMHNLTGRPADSVDHVTYHWPSGIAEIADRCAFDLLVVRGQRRLQGKREIPSFVIGRALSAIFPRANAECITLIYVLRPRRRP